MDNRIEIGEAVFIVKDGNIRASVCVGLRRMIGGEVSIYVASQYGDIEYPEEFDIKEFGKTIFRQYKKAKEALSNGNTVRDK